MTKREFIKTVIGLSAISATYIYARGMTDSMIRGPMGRDHANDNAVDSIVSLGKSSGVSVSNKLNIPPLLKGELNGNVREYNLTLQEGVTEFFKGIKTPTWGINGSYLGPTLLLRDKETVSVNYKNSLPEATTIHGHGMHVPAIMDGGVHQVIKPNSAWSAKYRVNQSACTNWYHPHIMGKTAEHVLRGLAGLIIIEDSSSKALKLPKRYGIDDIPLILQDRLFTREGFFGYSRTMPTIMHGFKGNTLLVNGTINPYFEAEVNFLRVRVLNGSNSRVYNLNADGVPMHIVAADNSFLEKPIKSSSIILSPAERVEVVLDLRDAKGKTISLKDTLGGFKLLDIKVNKEPTLKTILPKELIRLEPIELDRVKRKREFKLEMAGPGRLLINGKSMDKNRIDLRVKKDELEIWEVANVGMSGMMGGIMRNRGMGMNHNFHMHASHFRVLERNGSSADVRAWEKGYKDTVFLAPGDRVKLLVKHTDYTDSSNPYMYHCHFLEHEDAGMMGQFTVES